MLFNFNKIYTNNFVQYLKIARFDHWIKQLFIIPGIIFAFFLKNESSEITFIYFIILFIKGFASTSLIASANYIINEWLDAEFDKFHPIKKNRPVVSKNLKTKYIITEYIVFFAVGLFIAWSISFLVFLMELFLLIMGIIYNVPPFRSKEIPYIDVLSESINNAIRLLIGWFMITPDYLPPHQYNFGLLDGGSISYGYKEIGGI